MYWFYKFITRLSVKGVGAKSKKFPEFFLIILKNGNFHARPHLIKSIYFYFVLFQIKGITVRVIYYLVFFKHDNI